MFMQTDFLTAEAKAAIIASLADVRPSIVVETADQAAEVVAKWTNGELRSHQGC